MKRPWRAGRSNRVVVTALVAALVVGAAAWIATRSGGDSPAAPASAKAARYHCPMHPTMVADRPGDCPICGMRLVPIEEDDGGPEGAATPPPGHAAHGSADPDAAPPPRPGDRAPIRLTERKRQLIGVRTAPVERRPFVRTIRTVARVTYDETRLRHAHTKIAGWVEQLHANATGELVREGEPLLTIYSPELVASAQEYLLALHARERLAGSTFESARRSGERLVASARQRLLLFDVTPAQIAALERSGDAPRTMALHAPITGHIIARYVTQGQRIEPGTKLLDIADLSRVWALADVYEYELPFVHLGQAATMTLSYLPGRTFAGRITLVHPVLSEETRTVKVRLEFPNADFTLRPEMFAEVEIRADLGERLAVPESAVVGTGTRNIAFVEQGDGRFEPRELTLGIRLPDTFEVLGGLAEGERIVVSGNFLVDSESRLKAALAAAGDATAGAGHAQHSH